MTTIMPTIVGTTGRPIPWSSIKGLKVDLTGVACSWGIYYNPSVIDGSYINKTAASSGNNICKEFASRLLSLYSLGREIELNETLLDIKQQASLFAQNHSIDFNSSL